MVPPVVDFNWDGKGGFLPIVDFHFFGNIFKFNSWYGVYHKMTYEMLTWLKALLDGALDPWSCFLVEPGRRPFFVVERFLY